MNTVSGKSLWQLSARLSISTRGWAVAKIHFTPKDISSVWLPIGSRRLSQPSSMLTLLICHSSRKTLSLCPSRCLPLSLCERLSVLVLRWKKSFLVVGTNQIFQRDGQSASGVSLQDTKVITLCCLCMQVKPGGPSVSYKTSCKACQSFCAGDGTQHSRGFAHCMALATNAMRAARVIPI